MKNDMIFGEMILYSKDWISPNGKYYVKVRRFKADYPDIDVIHKVFVGERKKYIRHRDLPQYVKEQIELMRQEAINF